MARAPAAGRPARTLAAGGRLRRREALAGSGSATAGAGGVLGDAGGSGDRRRGAELAGAPRGTQGGRHRPRSRRQHHPHADRWSWKRR
ncbi:MAG: hypothetical protein MZW92_60250 [Comamonadaceae bacterium]|nr:hypothetical protein [Comamonadaceae bacterium]